jgi:hypothetical protein
MRMPSKVMGVRILLVNTSGVDSSPSTHFLEANFASDVKPMLPSRRCHSFLYLYLEHPLETPLCQLGQQWFAAQRLGQQVQTDCLLPEHVAHLTCFW